MKLSSDEIMKKNFSGLLPILVKFTAIKTIIGKNFIKINNGTKTSIKQGSFSYIKKIK